MDAKNKPFNRILLTNDDGYHAPGMVAMKSIAAAIADEVWVVAPASDQSGTSQSITLHDPLRTHQYGERDFAVTGTPADCVIVALEHIMKDAKPELVLSGVNRGANIADAVNYSGTIGAALTGKVMGVSALALSQAFKSEQEPNWAVCVSHAPDLIRSLVADKLLQDAACFNINFPAVAVDQVKGMEFSHQGMGSMSEALVEERVDTRGNAYQWISFNHNYSLETHPQSDVDVLRRARISVTPISQLRHGVSPTI